MPQVPIIACKLDALVHAGSAPASPGGRHGSSTAWPVSSLDPFLISCLDVDSYAPISGNVLQPPASATLKAVSAPSTPQPAPPAPVPPQRGRPRAAHSGLPALAPTLAAVGASNHHARIRQWSPIEQTVLLSFLTKLIQTSEADSAPWLSLGTRLQRLLAAACNSPSFRQKVVAHLKIALTTYGRRTIRALDDLEAALDIDDALAGSIPEATLALVLLSYGVMRLQIVHARATHHCLLVPHLDSNEVLYAYETQLRERLCLPGGTSCAGVPSMVPRRLLEVAALAAEAVSMDKAARQAFFASWQPWQRLLRRAEAAHMSQDDLPVRGSDN